MKTVTLVALIGRCAFVLVLVVLFVHLIRRKRAGQWKRPWTFPLAMTLLALALVSISAATVLEYMGM